MSLVLRQLLLLPLCESVRRIHNLSDSLHIGIQVLDSILVLSVNVLFVGVTLDLR